MDTKYAYITQNASGYLLIAASEEIEGIFTDGIESCFVFAVKGPKGIAVVHVSDKTEEQSIVEAFNVVEKVDEFQIIYNPNCYEKAFSNPPANINDVVYQNYLQFKKSKKLKFLCQHLPFIYGKLKLGNAEIDKTEKSATLANLGWVAIDKDFNIEVNTKPSDAQIIKMTTETLEDYSSAYWLQNVANSLNKGYGYEAPAQSNITPTGLYKEKNLQALASIVNCTFLFATEFLRVENQFTGKDFSSIFINKTKAEIGKWMDEAQLGERFQQFKELQFAAEQLIKQVSEKKDL